MQPTPCSWADGLLHRVQFEDLGASVVVPRQPDPRGLWAWRPEFLGAFPGVDAQLVARGWHIAYLDLTNHYGSPRARSAYQRFFEQVLIDAMGLAAAGCFIGVSRGGLSALHAAADRPDRCSCLYLDNPVCDFRSWPGGTGQGPGSPNDWRQLLAAHQLDDAAARAWTPQPLDRLDVIAKAGIPIVLVAGDADEVVPWPENGLRLSDRFRGLGGHIEVILKPGALHHPHGLDDPTPVTRFIEAAATARATA